MSLQTVESSTQEKPRYRTAHKFKDLEKGLEAARGQFPTDFIIGIHGDMSRPCIFAQDATTIRTFASLADFGKNDDDVVAIWLRGEQQPE
jgi:hypothetical protein